MKKLATIALFTLGMTISAIPAYADDNDWGWHMWGWGNGPGSGGMMGQGYMGRMAAIDSNNDGIIGDDEAAAGEVTLKPLRANGDMPNEQKRVGVDRIADEITSAFFDEDEA